MPNQPKEQFCEYCGESLGVYVKPYGSHDTCGKPECSRYERECEAQEREDEHCRLDERLGYGEW